MFEWKVSRRSRWMGWSWVVGLGAFCFCQSAISAPPTTRPVVGKKAATTKPVGKKTKKSVGGAQEGRRGVSKKREVEVLGAFGGVSSQFRNISFHWVASSPLVPTMRVGMWEGSQVYPLEKRSLLSGVAVHAVSLLPDFRSGGKLIHVELTAHGKRRFAWLTGQHKGRSLAIVVGGKIAVVAPVQTPITSGMARIRLRSQALIQRLYTLISGLKGR